MATSYSRFIDFLTYKAARTGTPLSGTFELTARCNLDCKMCYIHKKANDSLAKSRELSTEKWLETAKTAQKMGMFLLLVTGGEPFIRPDFFELYDEFKALGLSVSINTNGTLINDEIIRRLSENFPARVNLTLYGASEETYERLCGDGSAYKRAYNAVLGLKEAGIPVKLNYSVTPQNRGDFMQVCRFARDNELPIQPATYMFPPVRACELGSYGCVRIDADEAAQIAFDYDLFRFTPDVMLKRCEAMLEGNKIPDEDSECMEMPTEKIRCRAGLTAFWLTYDGQMRPCGMMQVPSVSMEELGFGEAWRMTREAREKILLPAQCTACSMRNSCESCPASCYAENHEFTVVPRYNCQKNAEYLRLAGEYVKNFQKK